MYVNLTFDNLRLNLCSICMRTGPIAKYCRSLDITCGICSLDHVTKTCQYFPIKLNRNEYTNLGNKKCSNCMGNKTFENQSLTHRSADTFECLFYKEQINRLQQQIVYGSN